MIVKALKRTVEDPEKALIGTVFGTIPFLNLITFGYGLRCSGIGKFSKKKGLPEWSGYTDMFVKGLIATIIGAIWTLPAFILLSSVIIGSFLDPSTSGIMMKLIGNSTQEHYVMFMGSSDMSILADYFFPALILFLTLFIVSAYFVPISVLGWLENNRFSSAFSKKVLRKAFNITYLTNWLLVGLINFLIFIVVVWVPYIGTGIFAYVSSVFAWTVFGEVYRKL